MSYLVEGSFTDGRGEVVEVFESFDDFDDALAYHDQLDTAFDEVDLTILNDNPDSDGDDGGAGDNVGGFSWSDYGLEAW